MAFDRPTLETVVENYSSIRTVQAIARRQPDGRPASRGNDRLSF